MLRSIVITSEYADLDVPLPRGCGERLQQRHFPRLRRFSVDGQENPV
jgi:hypothetical protein